MRGSTARAAASAARAPLDARCRRSNVAVARVEELEVGRVAGEARRRAGPRTGPARSRAPARTASAGQPRRAPRRERSLRRGRRRATSRRARRTKARRPSAALARLLHVLDLAAAHADLERVALGRAARPPRRRRRRARSRAPRETQVALAASARRSRPAVPPTVRPSMRSVGRPTPTGTHWPSLPQVPMPSVEREVVADRASRASARRGRCRSASRPCTGAPILPSSIR